MACDDNADFDEDIILPNSPLAQYVKELNCKESDNLFSECSAKETIQTEKCIEKSDAISFSLKIFFLKELTYWKDLLFIYFVQSSFRKGNTHLNTFLDTTSNSCLLTHEDRSFIKHLNSKTSDIGKVPPLFWSKPFFYLIFSLVTFCIIACVSTNLNNSNIIMFTAALFALFEILIFSFFIYCKCKGTEYHLACLSLLSFPSSTKITLMLIKDCGIRLIQEAELIARGFTSASVLGVAEHIELSFALPISSPSRQYSELRKCIFNWLRTTFIDYKTLTLNILQNIPVEKAFISPNCLATLNIDEFGGFLNYELDSSEILDVTDNFSIQSLKTMHRLAEMQISEFFKQIAIRLYLMNGKESGDCWEKIKDILWLVSYTKPLDRKMTSMYHEVYMTYKYYQSIEASYVDDEEVRSGHESKSPKSDLKLTLHNMCLHLKAALLRLIELEDQFDTKAGLDQFISRANSDQLDTNSKFDQLDMKTELDQFKNHIPSLLPLLDIAKSEVNAFDDCHSKFNKILDHLLHPENDNPSEGIPPVEIEPQSAANAPTSIERCDAEREIQDEVFEAIVSNAYAGSQQEGAAFIGEEARKNAELASFLLKELKNVLVNKADEHRIREQVALAKKTGDVNLIDNKDHSASGLDGNEAENETAEMNGYVKMMEVQNNFPCENEASLVEESEDFVLENNNSTPSLLNLLSGKTDSFAASIATLAAQRQKMLGLSSEEFIDGTDSDSDS